MKVIRKHRTNFETAQFNNVTNIAYDAGTKIYTITYGSSQTSSFSADNYIIFILN